MSRYLAAANAKRLALARSLSSFGVSLNISEDDHFRKEEDVDALIAASMAEVDEVGSVPPATILHRVPRTFLSAKHLPLNS